MPDKKISELEEITLANAENDFLPIVDFDEDETKKIKFSNLALSDSAKNFLYPFTTAVNSDNAFFDPVYTLLITGELTHSNFFGDDTLSDIYIGSAVPSIGHQAFIACTGLTDVHIPHSITSIGTQAFKGCKNITTVTIEDGATGIGNSAFKGCTSLTGIAIPDSVTGIGNEVFQNDNSLTSVKLPNNSSFNSIGSHAFY